MTGTSTCLATSNPRSLSSKAIASSYTDSNKPGPSSLESVYEEALAFELKERGLEVSRQVEVPVIYKGNELKTPLRLDLLVNNQVIVELKSVEEMKPVFAKQLLTYLKLMDKRVGLLVNFNTSNLRESIKRIVN